MVYIYLHCLNMFGVSLGSLLGFILFFLCTFIYLLFYIVFNSHDHIATGSLQVEETSAYCTVNHRASASNYQLSNMKHPAVVYIECISSRVSHQSCHFLTAVQLPGADGRLMAR